MKDWVIEKLKANHSFPNLLEKSRFILVGRIVKELTELQENKGPEFFAAYQAELGPILERVNWIYSKHPQFVWKRWNGVKRQIIKTLQGRDALVKVAPEVVSHQVNALQTMAKAFVQGHQINSPRPEKQWVKMPKKGWMKNPRYAQ